MDNHYQIELTIEGINKADYTLKVQTNQVLYAHQSDVSHEKFTFLLWHKTPLALSISSRCTVTFHLGNKKREIYLIITEIDGPTNLPDTLETRLVLESPTALLKMKSASRVFINEDPTDIAKILARPLFLEFACPNTPEKPLSFVQNEEPNFSAFLRFLSLMNWHIDWSKSTLTQIVICDTYDVENARYIGQLDAFSSWQLQPTACSFEYYQPDFPQTPNTHSLVKKMATPSYGHQYFSLSDNSNKLDRAISSWSDIDRESYIIYVPGGYCTSGDIVKINHLDYSIFIVIKIEKQQHEALTKASLTPITSKTYYPLWRDLQPKIGVIKAQTQLSPETKSCLSVSGMYNISLKLNELTYHSQTPYQAELSQPVTIHGKAAGFHFPLKDRTEVYCAFREGEPLNPTIIGANYQSLDNPVKAINSQTAQITTETGDGLYWEDKTDSSKLSLELKSIGSISLKYQPSQSDIQFQTAEGSMKVFAFDTLSYQAKKKIQYIADKNFLTLAKNHALDIQQSIQWQAAEGIAFYGKEKLEIYSGKGGVHFKQKETAWTCEDLTMKATKKCCLSSQQGLQMQGQDTLDIQPSDTLIIEHPLAKIVINDQMIELQSASCIHATGGAFSATPPLTYPMGT